MLIPFGWLASSGGEAGSYELIATNLLTFNATTISLGSIPAGTYKHLEIRYTVRNGTASNRSMVIKANNSTTGYAYHALHGDGAAVGSLAQTTQTAITLINNVPSYIATADVYGSGLISILDFNSTTKNKTFRALYGNALDGNNFVALGSGLWANTAAITSIQFSMQNGTIGIGSRFSLYGIKG